MPQPKSGRITRSPLDVPRMIHTDWRTLSSYCAEAIAPAESNWSGNPTPAPRKAFVMRLCPRSPDHDRAHRDDRPGRKVRGIVAGCRGVAVAGRHLAVDLDRGTAGLDGRLV